MCLTFLRFLSKTLWWKDFEALKMMKLTGREHELCLQCSRFLAHKHGFWGLPGLPYIWPTAMRLNPKLLGWFEIMLVLVRVLYPVSANITTIHFLTCCTHCIFLERSQFIAIFFQTIWFTLMYINITFYTSEIKDLFSTR